ncbi:MAG TPA: flagellar hook capping FlgD N-terminal domain-containing protein [Terriglobia bacterium]|nr:flagellar hook capping FlgD N-terminal domain-containing protein [Terriglobia bacterium]
MTINPLAAHMAFATNGASSSSGTGSSTGSSGLPSKQITTSDFMTLLTTQLQNQDPTNPVDPMQFVTQLAQFVTLDQVSQINTAIQSYVKGSASATGSQGASGSSSGSGKASGASNGA